jgi:lipoprotein signal peptidase
VSGRLPGWLALAALVVVLDQASKQWVLASFRVMESLTVTSFFNLVLVFNPGASFSFLADAGGWQKWFFIVLALASRPGWYRCCANMRRNACCPRRWP